MIILKKIYRIIHSYDPTNEHFINAMKNTIPGCLGIFCLVYFRWPFNLFIFFTPAFILVPSLFFLDYKNKIINMVLLSLEIMVGQFVICVFAKHQFVLIILLFFLFIQIYSSVKYRMVGGLAAIFIAISLGLPKGWYNGVESCIGILIAFILAIISLFLFEYFTTRFRIRSSLVYISELVNDSFTVFTEIDRKNISREIDNKYLFNRPFMDRIDIVVENIFKTKIDKFYHKVATAVYKADIVIEQEQYIFSKNIVYSRKAIAVYYFYRRLFREIAFLSGYYDLHEQINMYVPLTDELIMNLSLRLKKLSSIIKKREIPDHDIVDLNLIENWKENVAEFKKNDCRKIDKRILEFNYGLWCIIEDIEKLRKQLAIRYRIINSN
ncbi:MAG TPA: hypothetical protein QF753_22165 [Victivallales bacterium]|nr:hypothetical protein [Victivallales bacterium]